jgi:predicted Zn finger-like uncharacterized protein
MFTQCPDCQTTFRVSAEVLQQADGRVRCGGCGIAFNALDYLSQDDANADSAGDQALIEDTSDENRKLLETLDKLAGPDVELEDTGVEWRVLERPGGEKIDPDTTGSMKFVLEADRNIADTPAVHGRQSDLPRPPPDLQVPLDLPETDRPQSKPTERRYDDNTILPDDFGDEDEPDELPFLEAAMPKRRASDREAIRDTREFDEAQVDLALGDAEDWEDLLDEVDDEPGAAEVVDVSADDAAESEAGTEIEAADVLEAESADEEPPGEDMPSDIDTQFLLQAEELGLDTGNHPIVEVEVEDDDGTGIDEMAMDVEGDDDEQEPDLEDGKDEDELELSLEDDEETEEDEDRSDKGHEAVEEQAEPDKEDQLAAADVDDDEADDKSATFIGGRDVSELFKEGSPMVETIVMEGDLIGDSINQESRIAGSATGPFENIGPLEDTYSLNRGKVRGGRRASDPAGFGVIAGVVVLGLLLIGQIVHQSRQSLATYGAFNQTIGSIYRVLGKPVTPGWDIRGWRFEATNGNVDEEKDLLTIYSRIANKASQALPYPLVHISLTDRWEEVIGSRMLEPNEYLAGDLDPRKPVPPGENFTAVITIESPSADATGFRLTACYRLSPGRVRCADEHFKD